VKNSLPESIYKIRELYDQISDDWYRNIINYKKAQIIETDESGDRMDYYCHKNNIISIFQPKREKEIQPPQIDFLSIGKGDLEYNSEWEPWKLVIVEEAIHEYEHKIVGVKSDISLSAIDICRKYSSCFEPMHKHRYDFFQAIVEKASYFDLTAEELCITLGRPLKR
jgi:hypothetical protein